jgi:DNA-binding GntR family transcriptional regulator
MSGNPYLVDALERIVTPLFAFFVMKTSRERKSYVESAAAHEKIARALPKMSAAALRKLMKESIEGWKDEMLHRLLPEDL